MYHRLHLLVLEITIALIRWTNYTEDYIVTIPKDKIMTITNASIPMTESWQHISKEYDKSPLAPNVGGSPPLDK